MEVEDLVKEAEKLFILRDFTHALQSSLRILKGSLGNEEARSLFDKLSKYSSNINADLSASFVSLTGYQTERLVCLLLQCLFELNETPSFIQSVARTVYNDIKSIPPRVLSIVVMLRKQEGAFQEAEALITEYLKHVQTVEAEVTLLT